MTARDGLSSIPLFFFAESEALDHLPLLESLTPSGKAELSAKISGRHFQAGEQLSAQGEKTESVRFIYSGVIQVTRQVRDGRTMFDRSAIQPAVIEPHDLLWRIRNFFRINVRNELK